MKYKCYKETILKEISTAHDVITSKNSYSVLSNIYLRLIGNNLEIKSTDLKTSFETTIPVEGLENGDTKIYCDKFLSIIRNFPDEEIIFEKKNDIITLRNNTNSINYKLKSVVKESYPELKEIDSDKYFKIPQRDFIDMINQTIFAISDDETRYFMNGVYLEKNENKLNMVATDGRRLSIISKEINSEIPDFEPIIIPSKILNLVKKLSIEEGEISLAIYDNSFFVKLNDNYFTSNLIEGQFPNYKRVIPEQQDSKFIFNKSDVLNALRRVDLLVEKTSNKIYMNISNNNLTINSDNNDFGEAKESISCEYEGENCSLVLNSKYIEEPLKNIGSDKVEIHFSYNKKAISINSVPKKDFVHIVMPIQSN